MDWGISSVYTKPRRRTTLLRYWTTRYVFTLFVGLAIIAIGSMVWLQHTTAQNRLNLMKYLADETAERVISQGDLSFDPFFNHMYNRRMKLLQFDVPPEILIANLRGEILMTNPPRKGRAPIKLPVTIIETTESVQKVQLVNSNPVYIVKSPIIYKEEQVGWVVVMQDEKEVTNINQEYRMPLILLFGLGLLGWITIYILSRKISKPIQQVSLAATQIREGNYDIQLDFEVKEKEIHELIVSFKDMTKRLSQLEHLRAELLAGVTHDLKTPVTSISGLVQAVRDEVVIGEERKEFLDITLKEIQRLQSMIGDLLDFNSLAAGAVTIKNEQCNMNEWLTESVKEWAVTLEKPIEYEVITPDDIINWEIDSLRLQQILINLLNNAKQSIEGSGRITVRLSEKSIEIQDTGSGIPFEEQPYIFERFFRGENKKLKIRGLGLGLPFSKILAKAMHLDIVLIESTAEGTTFAIIK